MAGKWSDWLAAHAERRSATDAARFKRTIDREINRRVAAGELEPKSFTLAEEQQLVTVVPKRRQPTPRVKARQSRPSMKSNA